MNFFEKIPLNVSNSKAFDNAPPRSPCRVCVGAPLPAGQLLQMDCLLHDWPEPAEEGCFREREALHVQSLSHWAPANIGPYSQALRVSMETTWRGWHCWKWLSVGMWRLPQRWVYCPAITLISYSEMSVLLSCHGYAFQAKLLFMFTPFFIVFCPSFALHSILILRVTFHKIQWRTSPKPLRGRVTNMDYYFLMCGCLQSNSWYHFRPNDGLMEDY